MFLACLPTCVTVWTQYNWSVQISQNGVQYLCICLYGKINYICLYKNESKR